MEVKDPNEYRSVFRTDKAILNPISGLHLKLGPSQSLKCEITFALFESAGSISDRASITTNLLLTLCLLPKLEYTSSLAVSSLSATRSRVYGWSCLPDRNVPVALYAFMALPTWGPNLIGTDGNKGKILRSLGCSN